MNGNDNNNSNSNSNSALEGLVKQINERGVAGDEGNERGNETLRIPHATGNLFLVLFVVLLLSISILFFVYPIFFFVIGMLGFAGFVRALDCYRTSLSQGKIVEKNRAKIRCIEDSIRKILIDGIEVIDENFLISLKRCEEWDHELDLIEDSTDLSTERLIEIRNGINRINKGKLESQVKNLKKVMFLGLFGSLGLLSLVLYIVESLFLSVPYYSLIYPAPSFAFLFLGIGWIIYHGVIKANVTIEPEEFAIVLYLNVPGEFLGGGPANIPFYGVTIPGLNITLAKTLNFKKQEFVFNIQKDKTMLAAIAKYLQPLWVDTFITYRIIDIMAVVIATGKTSFDQMQEYFEGPLKDIVITNEEGKEQTISGREGGILDLAARDFIRNFFLEIRNIIDFEKVVDPTGREFDRNTDEDRERLEVAINKAVKEYEKAVKAEPEDDLGDPVYFKEKIEVGDFVRSALAVKGKMSKKLRRQFDFTRYFGATVVHAGVTDIKASADVEAKLKERVTTEQDISIAVNKKRAIVEISQSSLELIEIYRARGLMTGEIENILVLLGIGGEKVKEIFEGSSPNLYIAPALNRIADAFVSKNPPEQADILELLERPEEVAKVEQLLKSKGIDLESTGIDLKKILKKKR